MIGGQRAARDMAPAVERAYRASITLPLRFAEGTIVVIVGAYSTSSLYDCVIRFLFALTTRKECVWRGEAAEREG